MAGILLGCLWAFGHMAKPDNPLRSSIHQGVVFLGKFPVPAGICVFLGLCGIIICLRYAAINTQGRTRRMPGLIWRVSIVFLIAAICELIARINFAGPQWFRAWFVTEVTLLAAIPICILTFTRFKNLWFAKTETFLLVTVVSGACLASRSLIVGLVWTLALSIFGYCLGDWIGWCQLAYRRLSVALEIFRWLIILAMITWVTIDYAAFDNVFADHLFHILADVLLIGACGPMRILPAFRPPTDENNSETESRSELETTFIKIIRSGKGKAAIQKAAARLERSATGKVDRTILMELDAAQWTATREQWPEILEKESALLLEWLELEAPGRATRRKEITRTDLMVGNPPIEACLRLMVYECRSGEAAAKGISTERAEFLYQLLRSMGKKQPVITHWLLWRAFFARFPDSVEEAIQQEKLLVYLEIGSSFDLLGTIPPSLWMDYKSNAFKMLRIAEHAAWRAVVIAGRHPAGSELAVSVFEGCSDTWETTRRTLMLAEHNPIALISAINGSTSTNPAIIEKALKRAERRRPALRMAQYWTTYAEHLTQLAGESLFDEVHSSAEKLKGKLRKRISGGFSLPKPEVK